MDIVKAFQNNNLCTNITIGGNFQNPLFKASDVGLALDIKNVRTSILKFSEKQKVVRILPTPLTRPNILFLYL